jgi:cytochrome P450
VSADTRAIYDPDTYVRGMPYAELRRLRATAPVVWVDEAPFTGGPGFWAVLGHAEVREVLRAPEVFSSHEGATQIRDPATPDDLAYVRRMMLNMDPPAHTRLRGLLARAFTPRAVARLVDRIEERAEALVAAVADCGAADFATDIAADLPLLTLADVFGVPEADRWLMYDWSNRVIGYQDAEYAVSAGFDPGGATGMGRRALALRPGPGPDGTMPDPRSRAGMPDLYAYAHDLGAYKRDHPGDDVMSILMRERDADGGRVSVEEFENLFWLFSVAGNETLRNGLPGGMYALLTNPDAYRGLRADPGLLDTCVEEMLRWWTPVMNFRRTATRAARLGGAEVRAGDKVVVWYASANRDPAVFADPDTFDPARRPGEHLSFGHGPHFCLGAQLARTQMRALFRAVLGRLGEVELAGDPVRLRSNFQNGIKHLPVTWAA